MSGPPPLARPQAETGPASRAASRKAAARKAYSLTCASTIAAGSAGGELADVAARHLVVEPALELLARKLVHEAGMGEQIAVHVLASLPTGRWYLLGDPALQPAVGVLRLGGARVPALIEQTKTPMDVDAVSLRVRADAGAAMLGRVGIVRGGA